ncbi:hypothetical protein [Flagellimonas marinaquae]|uniref:hypothetical protein n=1 Tax=Flagellimonas marinaquae TaxID=254955 RepID=UPI002075F10E|nr:hypothetical protein [Allomuricauda aquimarina]USD25093.1 hypothetical protein MJO53_15555 [Allomuricauda aquimarina]
MKSKLNIWLLVSFLIAGILTLWLYFKLTGYIWDISYDEAVDSEEFSPCGEYSIYPYYHVGTYHRGGKKHIKKKLLSKINTEGLPSNGLLTVRFVVNCKGETGYFRTKMTDAELKEINVPTSTLEHFYNLILELEEWMPGKIKGTAVDSYAQIVFKVEQGKITDIF